MNLAVVGQLLIALGSFLLLAFYPPPQGRMLLIPLGEARPLALLDAALAADARLVAPGPLAGSFVINGSRANIMAAVGRLGGVLLAAPPAGCARELPA